MSCIEIPDNITLPYDPSSCVYEIKFPDLEEIYIGMTLRSIGSRIDAHLAKARAKKHGNKNLEKLIRRALYEEERMVVDVLDRGIFEEKDLQQKEAERIMEVMEAGVYKLLNIQIPNIIVDGKKYCPGCKKIKVVEKFSRHSGTNSGIRGQCKACHNEYTSGLCYEISEEILANGKKCGKCEKVKSAKEFPRDRCDSSGLTSWCKACHNEAQRERYHKKQAKILAQKKVVQYTLFGYEPAHVSVSATGAIVPIET